MNKLGILIICVTLAFAFCACGSTPYYGADEDKAYETQLDNQIYEDEDGSDEYNRGYYDGYEDGRNSMYEDYDIDDYEWLLENVVFYTGNDGYYHKSYCNLISEADVYVAYYFDAEDDGYNPCPECHIEEPRLNKDK